jgi:WD40 repeat protein
MRSIILVILTFVTSSLLAQKPALVVQNGHTNIIQSATISSDNKWLATGGIDHSIKIWDITTGKLIKNFDNGDAIYTLAFFQDNERIISGGYGNNTPDISFWSMDSDSVFAYLDVDGGAISIDFSENYQFIAVSTSSGDVSVWEVSTGEKKLSLSTKEKYTLPNVLISEKYNLIMAGSSDITETNFIYLWDLESGKFIKKLSFPFGIAGMHLLENNELLLENQDFTRDGRVFKVNYTSGVILDTFEIHNAAILNNKTQVIGQEKPFSLAIYDIATGNKVGNIPTKIEYPTEIIVSPDEATLVIMNQDFEILSLKDKASKYLIKGNKWIDGMSFDANASKLAFSGRKGEIVNWNLETGEIDLWKAHKGIISDIYYHKNGEVLASLGLDSNLIVYNKNGEKLHTIKFNDNDFSNISMTVDGKWITVAIKDSIYSIQTETGEKPKAVSFWGLIPDRIGYSPNSKDFVSVLYNSLINYDLHNDSIVLLYQTEGGLQDIAFSYDGKYIATGGYTDSILVIEVATSKVVFKLSNNEDYVSSVAFDPTSYLLAVGYQSGQISLIDVAKKEIIGTQKEHGNIVSKISFNSEGKIMASASWDGKLILWDVHPFRKKAELYVFEDQSWAVIDESGRYDASNAGNIDALHFVVNQEAIALDQLKQRYYEPGLLQKLLGFSAEELRDVQQLNDVKLFAHSNLSFVSKDVLGIMLQERSGGIGQVQFFINNKEVVSDVSNLLIEINDGIFYTEIKINDFGKYIKEGTNLLAIKVYNQENYLSSPKIPIEYEFFIPKSEEEKVLDPIDDKPNPIAGFSSVSKPTLYGIVIGTADYKGIEMDLKYADKDATSFYKALAQSGAALFGSKNTNLQLLCTDTGSRPSSKENIKAAFAEVAAKAGPNDAVVVYLSGHGMNYQSNNETQFYYLTKDLENSNLADESIRNAYAISTSELTDWIKNIAAEKQVLILDACASGKAIEDIMVNTKGVSSSQIRALERMKDRTGMFVLAGSTSDQVSYEASQFGQSLLTYSLLSGMKGQALRENEFVDVAKLFEHSVDYVPTLAEYIGGVQKPILAIPYGGSSFDIGKVDTTVKIDLPSIKPVFIRSSFQDEFEFADVLGLSAALDNELRNFSTKGAQSEIIFVDVSKYPKAYSIKGRYAISGEQVKIAAKVFNDSSSIGEFGVEGNKNDIDTLIEKLLLAAYDLLGE